MSRFPSVRLDGKVAVITGASSGIGFACAEAMSEAGARVVLAGRDRSRLEACAQMYLDGTPYGRVGVVDDVAPLAVFLASDGARYIHGESVLVDGGWAAR